jgi:hypothetical protein
MSVKRFTIELDDRPDGDQRTAPPSSLLPRQEALPRTNEGTDMPSRQDAYSEAEAQRDSALAPYAKETVGRTPADLVFAFVNKPEFMATTLTFLAILVTVGKLEKATDVWIMILTAIILNGVWFGIVLVRFLFCKNNPATIRK